MRNERLRRSHTLLDSLLKCFYLEELVHSQFVRQSKKIPYSPTWSKKPEHRRNLLWSKLGQSNLHLVKLVRWKLGQSKLRQGKTAQELSWAQRVHRQELGLNSGRCRGARRGSTVQQQRAEGRERLSFVDGDATMDGQGTWVED
ncbi:hypothetical protein CRG98_012585 [Punica granatum]|uniref:Uncharacterized protein n=1 Tax=Punica granatum TaxID=22663 RepID=A0A2I0KEW8_PUNGR|nr:hypothetical protein CRG98_012585 [Punica granatum]